MISVEQARALYAAGDAAHDFDHVLRVTALAVHIAQAEGADVEIVRTAALLHDIGLDNGRVGHEEVAAERARGILAGQPPEKVEAVTQAIRSHRFRAGPPPQTLEAKCLFDADKLDAIGAIGVARVFAYGGAAGQRLWAEVPEGYDEHSRAASTPPSTSSSSSSPRSKTGSPPKRAGASDRRATTLWPRSLRGWKWKSKAKHRIALIANC